MTKMATRKVYDDDANFANMLTLYSNTMMVRAQRIALQEMKKKETQTGQTK